MTRSTGVGNCNRVKTHCPRGHAYDQANTRLAMLKNRNRLGGPIFTRTCRTCERERHQHFRETHR